MRLLDGILSLKSLTRFSNELARSSIIALDAALRDRMVFDVAAKLDTALIAGTGDLVAGKRTTPLGIINYAGVQETPPPVPRPSTSCWTPGGCSWPRTSTPPVAGCS